jgi:hypothetical protein
MISIQLPSQLSSLAGGKRCIEVEAASLGEVFRKVDDVAPMIRSQIFDATGAIRQFMGLFLDEHLISDLGDGSQSVRDGSRILIVMSVAGG